MGVVIRRYIDFIILLIPTPLVFVLFCSSIPTFCSFFKVLYHRVCRLYKYRDELDARLTQYITNAGIFRGRYTLSHILNTTIVYHGYFQSNKCIT